MPLAVVISAACRIFFRGGTRLIGSIIGLALLYRFSACIVLLDIICPEQTTIRIACYGNAGIFEGGYGDAFIISATLKNAMHCITCMLKIANPKPFPGLYINRNGSPPILQTIGIIVSDLLISSFYSDIQVAIEVLPEDSRILLLDLHFMQTVCIALLGKPSAGIKQRKCQKNQDYRTLQIVHLFLCSLLFFIYCKFFFYSFSVCFPEKGQQWPLLLVSIAYQPKLFLSIATKKMNC
ncbi:MAG: hypothetical protein ABI644_02955 [Arenimonas sp.]